VAVITTIAKAHVGHLGSIEAIADEKASIMHSLEPNGVAVLPIDSPYMARLRAFAGDAAIVSFGTMPDADVRLQRTDSAFDGSLSRVALAGRLVSLRLQAPGRHMVMNALAALATVIALNLDPTPAI